MDRHISYDGSIPQATEILDTEINAYVGIAKLAASVLGINTLLNNFTCTPSSPADLNVNISAGEIYSLKAIDSSSYGDLPSNSHLIMKQGINLDPTVLAITAPATVGYSRNYLIQFAFNEVDTDSVVLNYYNATNPASPYSGPGNSGLPNYTTRADQVSINAKAGVDAPTGTQTTPTPDSGYVGAFVVTIANGQTTITSGNITSYVGSGAATFITETLTQKISQATADARYAQQSQIQNNQFNNCIDTGTANALITSITPAIISYTQGLSLNCKVLNTNTTASTINVNGVGVVNIKLTSGADPYASAMIAGGEYQFIYDGTNFQLLNPTFTASVVTPTNVQNNYYNYAVDSGTANSYAVTLNNVPVSYTAGLKILMKVANSNTGSSIINVNSLGSKNIKLQNGSALLANNMLANGVYILLYDGTNFQLLNPHGIFPNYVLKTSGSGSITPSAGVLYWRVQMIGGGAGGWGGTTDSNFASYTGSTPTAGQNTTLSGNSNIDGSVSLSAMGGNYGSSVFTRGGVAGQGVSINQFSLDGEDGRFATGISANVAGITLGGRGGNSFLGNGGHGGECIGSAVGPPSGVGSNAVSNTGGGGGGGSAAQAASTSTTCFGGGGGGAGGYIDYIVRLPSGSFTYSVGAGGNGGSGGSGGGAGGNGGSGVILITEYYQ